MSSKVDRIRSRLGAVIDRLSVLLHQLPVEYIDNNGPVVILGAPEYHYGNLSDAQRASQVKLKRDYESLFELLRAYLRQAPEALLRQFKTADDDFRKWLELKRNWSLTRDAAKNEVAFRAEVKKFEAILSVLSAVGKPETLLVPDTNSLILQPEPVQYSTIAGQPTFTLALMPTVLAELDHLKTEHRNQTVRDKALKVLSRIKGWRQQGSLVEGVIVDKTITIWSVHGEPDMKHTLSWLDKDVPDDRILASVLELEVQYPAARVVLVTRDFNLLNKADAALIEAVEAPQCPPNTTEKRITQTASSSKKEQATKPSPTMRRFSTTDANTDSNLPHIELLAFPMEVSTARLFDLTVHRDWAMSHVLELPIGSPLFREENIRDNVLEVYSAENQAAQRLQYVKFFGTGKIVFRDSSFSHLPNWQGVFYPQVLNSMLPKFASFCNLFLSKCLGHNKKVSFRVEIGNIIGCERKVQRPGVIPPRQFFFDLQITAGEDYDMASGNQADLVKKLYDAVILQSMLDPKLWGYGTD